MGKKKDKKKGMDMEAKLVAANRMALAAFEAADALQRRALESGSGVEEATDALRCALEALGAVQAADSRPRDEELVRSASSGRRPSSSAPRPSRPPPTRSRPSR